MQRVQREVTDVEMIDTLQEIIDLVIDNYGQGVAPEFQKASRASQIGKGIVDKLLERNLMERFGRIGYQSQRILLDHQLIKTGGIENG